MVPCLRSKRRTVNPEKSEVRLARWAMSVRPSMWLDGGNLIIESTVGCD